MYTYIYIIIAYLARVRRTAQIDASPSIEGYLNRSSVAVSKGMPIGSLGSASNESANCTGVSNNHAVRGEQEKKERKKTSATMACAAASRVTTVHCVYTAKKLLGVYEAVHGGC